MQINEIDPILIDVFTVVLGHPVTVDVSRETDGAWDSLRHMQLVFAVESAFSVRFDENTISRMHSFRDFANQIRCAHET